jgi:hypothetical protein
VEEICIKSGAFCEAQHKKMRIVNEEEFERNKLRKNQERRKMRKVEQKRSRLL